MSQKQSTSTMFSNLTYDNNERVLDFDVKNIDTSMINAVRRSVLNDVTNIGFGYEPENTVTILKNTTGLHDEFISHRIALIPVMLQEWMNNKSIDFLNQHTFTLNVSQKKQMASGGLVTTDDFVLKRKNGDVEQEIDSQKCFPREPVFKTPILITRFPHRGSIDQELHLECKLTYGTHSKHASFSPTTVCVAYEHDDDSTKHHFMLESVGVWHPHALVAQGFDNLLQRCVNVKDMIANNNIARKYKGQYMAIDYVMKGESHTLGNMLQEWIYKHEFEINPNDRSVDHISYHEPHPLEDTIIVRMSLKDKNIDVDFEEYSQETTRILEEYINSLEDYLRDCKTEWMKHAPASNTLL